LRVAQLASLIAVVEGADPARSALLAIWHDSQETRAGDIPHTAKPYLSGIDNEAVTADQVGHICGTTHRQRPSHRRRSVDHGDARLA
jgi:putative hydrolase of HD superfamily